MKALSSAARKSSRMGSGSQRARRVLMLVENVPAPADRRVWPEGKALRGAGYQVSIICSKGRGQYEEPDVWIYGITIYRYRLPAVRSKYLDYIADYGMALLMTFLLCFKVLFRQRSDLTYRV